MGLFDIFKSKSPSSRQDDGPSAHYVLAHYALRSLALDDPMQFLAIMASPEADRFIDAVMQDVTEQFSSPATFRASAVKVHPVRAKEHACAVLEMPEPQEVAEAHMVALTVPVADLPEQMDDRRKVAGRYFTLEKGLTVDGQQRTVLCEWDEQTHRNYGDGPAVDVEQFIAAVGERL